MENKNLDSIIKEIQKINTREDFKEYMTTLKLNKNELLNIGKKLNCNVNTKDNKNKLIEWIENGTVGNKLRIEAISQIDLSK